MKIAIDIRASLGNKAGKGWYTYQLVDAMLSIDTQNEYVLYTNETQKDFLKFKNAKQQVITKSGLSWHFAVKRDISNHPVDFFIAPSSYIIPFLLPKTTKSIVVVHDLVALLFPKNHNFKASFIEKITIKKALKKAFKIISVSNSTKQDLIKNFSLNDQDIDIIYPAITKDYKNLNNSLLAWKEERNLPEHFFLFVGTLEPRKNITNLLKAHAKIIDPSKKRKDQLHLVIIGSRGWKFSEIFSTLNDLRTAEYVHFTGYVKEEDLVKYYNTAIALVFPSLYEGFGLPLLEAMQSACPVIASNNSSIPEVVGQSAVLVDPTNIEGLADSMKKIYHNHDLRDKCIVEGLKQSQKFSWQKSALELLNIITTSNGKNSE